MNRLLILASLLLVVSCNKETMEVATEQNSAKIVTLSASLTDVETRVSVDNTNANSWTFEWEDGDAISAWHSTMTDATTDAPLEFEMSNFDSDNSAFSGTLGEGENHRFIYPYEEEATITSDGYYTIDVSVQNGTLNKTYLINDGQIATSDINDNTVSSLDMKHLGGFMVVDIYLENFNSNMDYRLKAVGYLSMDNIIPETVEIDMTKEVGEDGFYNNPVPGYITAEMDEEFKDVEGTAYRQVVTNLNILPFTVAENQTATIFLDIDVYEKDSETLLDNIETAVTVSNNSGAPLPFARATHNFTYLTVDLSTEVEITGATINGWGEIVDNGDLELAERTYTASEIDGDNVPVKDTWTITDSGEITHELMEGVRAALLVAEEEGRSIKIVMPNATSIGDNAFVSFTYEGESLFYVGYPALIDIELPNVTVIGDLVFFYSSFTSFDFTKIIEIGDDAFNGCLNLTELINFSLTSIPESAFQSCNFTSFDFTGVTEIGMYAFGGCENLTEVTNFNFTTIPAGLFVACGFTSFDFRGVEVIETLAFYYCQYLPEIEIPSSVTSIGSMAFRYSGVTTVTLNWTGSDILTYSSADMWFEGTPLKTIYIPAGTTDDYVAKGWDSSLLVEKEE